MPEMDSTVVKPNIDHVSTTVVTGLGPRRHSLLHKTEDINERKAFCYNLGDARKIESMVSGL